MIHDRRRRKRKIEDEAACSFPARRMLRPAIKTERSEAANRINAY